MGVAGLFPFLLSHARQCIKPLSIEHLKGKRIALDGNLLLFREYTSPWLAATQPKKNILWAIRLMRLCKTHGIHPIVVFDSPQTTPAKARERANRAVKRSKYRAALELSKDKAGRLKELASTLSALECLEKDQRTAILAKFQAVQTSLTKSGSQGDERHTQVTSEALKSILDDDSAAIDLTDIPETDTQRNARKIESFTHDSEDSPLEFDPLGMTIDGESQSESLMRKSKSHETGAAAEVNSSAPLLPRLRSDKIQPGSSSSKKPQWVTCESQISGYEAVNPGSFMEETQNNSRHETIPVGTPYAIEGEQAITDGKSPVGADVTAPGSTTSTSAPPAASASASLASSASALAIASSLSALASASALSTASASEVVPSLSTASASACASTLVDRLTEHLKSALVVDASTASEELSLLRALLKSNSSIPTAELKNLQAVTADIIDKLSRRMSFPTSKDVYRTADQLRKYGIPVQISPDHFEGECTACLFVRSGYADYVASEDSDVLVYGVPLIRGFGSVHPNNRQTDSMLGSMTLLDPQTMRRIISEDTGINKSEGLNWTESTFLSFAILCGTDFTKRIPQVGVEKAYKLISQQTSLDGVVEALKATVFKTGLRKGEQRYKIHDEFETDAAVAREIFSTFPENHAMLQDKLTSVAQVERAFEDFARLCHDPVKWRAIEQSILASEDLTMDDIEILENRKLYGKGASDRGVASLESASRTLEDVSGLRGFNDHPDREATDESHLAYIM